MSLIPPDVIISPKDLQSEKASEYISVTEEGIVIDSNPLPLKALPFIEVTVSGIERVLRELQFRKAPSLILSIIDLM
jgi:hypothetical protein